MLPSAALLVILTRPPRDEERVRDGTQAAEQSKKAKPKQTYPFFRLDDDHPALHLGKGTHIDFRGRFAVDADHSEASTEDPAETAAIDLGKKRLGVSGEIVNAIEFQVEAELTSDDPWRDVYAEFKSFDVARVRGGSSRSPSAWMRTPAPPVSTSCFGRWWRRTSRTGARHRRHGARTRVEQGDRLRGRCLRARRPECAHEQSRTRSMAIRRWPRASRSSRCATRRTRRVISSIGVAFTQRRAGRHRRACAVQTVLDQTFFSSKYIVNGTRSRTGVELAFVPGPASIKAEWIRMETERRGESVEDTDLSPLVGQGWVRQRHLHRHRRDEVAHAQTEETAAAGRLGAIEVGARDREPRVQERPSAEPGRRSPRADTRSPESQSGRPRSA